MLLTTRTQRAVDFTHRMQNSHQIRMSVVALCSINKAEKLTKESKFFSSFDFETSNDNDDEAASKCYRSTLFEFFFAEKICSFWAIFSALRFEIAISFDEIIYRKSKTIAAKIFVSMTFSTRKIFWVVLSTETLRREDLKSEIIEKMTTKNEKRHRNDVKKTLTRIRKWERKQRNNVNRSVVVKNRMIHLMIHHKIVLYQN